MEQKPSTNTEISYGRVALSICGLIIAIAVFNVATPTSQSLLSLIILMSVLTVAAVIGTIFIGDASKIYAGTWRIASAYRRSFNPIMVRQIGLIYMYLATMLAAFFGTLDWQPAEIAGRIALALGTASLLFTFKFPVALNRIIEDGWDEEVKQRKQPTDKNSHQHI